MNDTPRTAQIAHVLVLDIVGYSRETTSAQGRLLAKLTATVQGSGAFAAAMAGSAVQPIPTGDGMALLFTNDVIAPARCAAEVSQALRGSDLRLRMGIHSGLVQKQIDIAGRENVVGEGINTAQRVMDFGDAGHILLSAQYATWLLQFDDWTALVHPLGEGTAKHGQRVQLFSLHSAEFGRSERPLDLSTADRDSLKRSSREATVRKVALLYKPNLQPDETVLRYVEEQLRANGHDVFVDNQQKIDKAWATEIEDPIRTADAVIAIVSPKSMQSEMLEFEIETAHDQHARTGKPTILPVQIGDEESVGGIIGSVIGPLTQFMWRGPEDDQRLVVELLSAINEPLKPRAKEVQLEPVGGAVPPDSPFYVERPSDQEFTQALERRESIILIKGARQMGKTSMEARGAKLVREQGWRCGITDFQKFNAAQLASDDTFYQLLAATLARQLGFAYDFKTAWEPIFGPNMNMENFMRELLDSSDSPLVWFMDEADKLFGAQYASDFFGLVRSWHNSRSTEPGGPWDKLTVVIAYATEAHLFIQDLNQSPFNVGRRLELEDFNIQQLMDLNARYGGPLGAYSDIERLNELIGGQPFLARRALDLIASGKLDLAGLIEQADREEGPFGDHLKRVLVSASRLPNVVEYIRSLLDGRSATDQDAHYRLLAAGIIRQTADGVGCRCALYDRYLRGHLLRAGSSG